MAIYLNANELLRSLAPEEINARWLVKIMMESKEHNMTNADRVRSMTDEELADIICDRSCAYCPLDCDGRMSVGRDACYKRWLEWLKQEVDE